MGKEASRSNQIQQYPPPLLPLGPSFKLPFLVHTLFLASAPCSGNPGSEKKNDKMLATHRGLLSFSCFLPSLSLPLLPSPGSSFLFFPLYYFSLCVTRSCSSVQAGLESFSSSESPPSAFWVQGAAGGGHQTLPKDLLLSCPVLPWMNKERLRAGLGVTHGQPQVLAG